MTLVTFSGFPRIGLKRELKRALESYWRGDSPAQTLLATGRLLRQRHWQLAVAAGADVVPCNDFSLYDQVLDTAVLFDAIPAAIGRSSMKIIWTAISPWRAATSAPGTICTRWK